MWQPGQVILDEYRVHRLLGAGGMASVFEVRHLDRETSVAVKVPHAFLVQTPEQRLRFAAELQIWVGLPVHSHIVQCFFVREVNQAPAVFAEFVRGSTLAQALRRGKLKNRAATIDLAAQLADAMCLAQSRGIVHQDLKPANCLLADDGRLKLSDFGLAAAIGATIRTASYGTEAYCAPEQFDGQAANLRTDMWSFGVTLFEMLTGSRPRLGPAARSLVETHARSANADRLNSQLYDLLLALLQMAPEHRPASFVEVRGQLQAMNAQGARATPHTSPSALGSHAAPKSDSAGDTPSIAYMMLRQALKEAGRDPADADALTSKTRTSPKTKAGALGELAVLFEAVGVYKEAISRQPTRNLFGQLALTLHITAMHHRRLGDLASAADCFAQGVDAVQSALALGDDAQLLALLAEELNNFAVCSRALGRIEQALHSYDRAIDVLLNGREQPDAPRVLAAATMLQNKAMALLKSQRLVEAAEQIDRAARIADQLVQRVPGASLDVACAGIYLDYGVILRHQGHVRAAIAQYDRVLALWGDGAILDQMSDVQQVQVGRVRAAANAHLNRCAAHLALGDPAAGLADADRAMLLFASLQSVGSAEDQWRLSQAYNNRSNALREMGQLSCALEDMQRCVEIRERLVNEDGMEAVANELGRAYANLALMLGGVGELDQAVAVAAEGLRSMTSYIQRKGRIDLEVDCAFLRHIHGAALCEVGKLQEGLVELGTAVVALSEHLGTRTADVVSWLLQALEAYLMAAMLSPSLPSNLISLAECLTHESHHLPKLTATLSPHHERVRRLLQHLTVLQSRHSADRNLQRIVDQIQGVGDSKRND